ncbi:hypothetical protein RFI_14387 [Reticulomyxa filosa]|uniref:Uncharacterized protein n=1 Tax=Reticulomyxa filosa TaxID=46433 RepID=X6N935_RETFI|nr:hypothetical protein RFI_14387 [Reticulomyxa filosa]|eukprot:ETO22805.1 hypothetical protein RFI_14387 [Reticulomyxa filosa]
MYAKSPPPNRAPPALVPKRSLDTFSGQSQDNSTEPKRHMDSPTTTTPTATTRRTLGESPRVNRSEKKSFSSSSNQEKSQLDAPTLSNDETNSSGLYVSKTNTNASEDSSVRTLQSSSGGRDGGGGGGGGGGGTVGAMTMSDTTMTSSQGEVLLHVHSWEYLLTYTLSEHSENKETVRDKVLSKHKNSLWIPALLSIEKDSLKFTLHELQSPLSITSPTAKTSLSSKALCSHTLFLSEMSEIQKSYKTVDGQRFVLEIDMLISKIRISLTNVEQRDYWHQEISHHHLNYYVWRSSGLDGMNRCSRETINAVSKALKREDMNEKEQLCYQYVEDILKLVNDLMKQFYRQQAQTQRQTQAQMDAIPSLRVYIVCRLFRLLHSVRFFFMSYLKSISFGNVNVILPECNDMKKFLQELKSEPWSAIFANTDKDNDINSNNNPSSLNTSMIDFLIDKMHRQMLHLSFALTSTCCEQMDKVQQDLLTLNTRSGNNNYTGGTNGGGGGGGNALSLLEKEHNELKSEYNKLKRSWEVHRERLQEYVIAHRDAVAQLKNSFAQRTNCAKS